MAVNSSKVSHIFDADPSVTLRDIKGGAETSTATETGIALNELNSAYWHDKEIPNGVFPVVINISALDKANADETYVLSLLVDDQADMADSPVTIASIAVSAVGTYTVYVNSRDIPKLDPDSNGGEKYIAVRATLAGTTPSITYGAWIERSNRAA